MKTNRIFTVLLLLFASIVIQAQPAAIVYGGIAKLTNQDKIITPNGMAHPGFSIGMDGMLSRDGLNLMAGIQYHQFHFIANKNSSFFGMEENLSYTKLRFGFNAGIPINETIRLRFYGLGSGALLTHLPSATTDVPQKSMTDAYVAGIGGASFIFGPGVLSFEYEKGLMDAAINRAGSKMNSYMLSLGLMF